MSDSAAPVTDALDNRILLAVLAQVNAGDFTARMPLDLTGVAGKVADSLNEIIIANQLLASELTRVSEVVGKQGKLSQRVVLGGSAQSWSKSLESVNSLIDDLVRPASEMQRVIGAVAEITGRTPKLSTSGGTSDARFITHYCPVVEFGLVGQTMHQVDERTPVSDLEKLTRIYRGVLDRYFA